ncbi:O-antigen ligase family protein [Pelagibacterium xiamenense]|uniref:O-antigen ligase family protein n=1 Tax=Pelagibacterium xiamenense TaxID=2901140 RepID=UPI001E43277F|nr:O-antigen ligase family protein [Pelagibacterium xiamenense]MCD7058919.1 O-antigen ligase family protein [Pelagibacterium xiamenense]
MSTSSIDPIRVRTTHPASRRSSFALGSGQAGTNTALSAALVVFLFLAPIPLGGNRPFFWAVNAVAVGLAALVYAVAMMRAGETWRISVRQQASIVVLWAASVAFLIVQFLPLGDFWDGLYAITRDGTKIPTLAISVAPGETALMALRMLTYGMFFFLVLQLAANRTRAALVLRAIFIIVCAHAAYGLLAVTQLGDPLLFFEKWAYEGSATGTFVNRNSYATFLAFGLVIGLVSALRALFSGNGRRGTNESLVAAALYLTGTVVIAAALVATRSRMGLAAGALGCALCALVVGLKLWSRRKDAFFLGAGLTLGLTVAAFFLFGSGTLERLGSTEQDLDVRVALYTQVIQMIAERPWLGFGGGAFEVAYPLFHALPVSPDRIWDRAHSTYLSRWTEMGVVFGSLPMVILLIIGWQCARFVRRREQDWWLPLVAVGVLAVGAVHSTVDFSLEMQANTFFLLAILALGVSHYTHRQESR